MSPNKDNGKSITNIHEFKNGNNNNMNNKMVRQYDNLDIIVQWPTCMRYNFYLIIII